MKYPTLWVLNRSFLVLAVLMGCSSADDDSTPSVPLPPVDPMASTPMIAPGVNEPAMVEGHRADIAEETEIIGVLLPTGARAYPLPSMSQISTHVVNDMIDEIPISVTYCDLSDRARVFTREDANSRIGMMVGGRYDGEMLLMLDGIMYPQNSPEIPLAEIEFTRTDWRTWYAEHPDTVVFVGQLHQDDLPQLSPRGPEADL